MRVLIATGGTGGHIFPGLAIADELRKLGINVLMVGSKFGMESKLIPAQVYKLRLTSQKPLVGRGLRSKVEFPFLLLISLFQAFIILLKEKPYSVIGTGGFGSFSIVFVAALLGISTLITEIDIVPGLTTRILSRFVTEIHLAFKSAQKYLPAKKVRVTGFPVRQGVLLPTQCLKDFGLSDAKDKVTIFIFGGSRGAYSINRVFKEALILFPKDFQFIWQTGANNLKDLTTTCLPAGKVRARYPNVHAQAFIQDIGSVYHNSQLVISRAGALTIGELIAVGLPAILIPYPYAAGGHQLLNARFLESAGAAKVILDSELTPTRLVDEVSTIIRNKKLWHRMSQAAKSLAVPGAAKKIAQRAIGKRSAMFRV